ncbi:MULTISPECIES: hypothetical protein [Gammaproteobacteria]|uniref:Uncharacterized protein n=6 Tax=Gammaproteobacteria TaxID=1236 RepID=A0A368TRA3_9GAMM|nr:MULTISPECIES: hypothetical protein [Gammaproteobacteria]MBQ5557899.1 hypothetical protein [Aeriscardovia sp.]MBQ9003024.1 hypothetical protein [Eggerthellaceae bacterium]MBH0013648.1 hypothetical protein [Pseudoalteromonas sp. NZS100_1]MBH0052169.1 hypothetical protein [Pseudoalteromonas sp. SWYJZ19]RCV87138.1 hypothetical protein DU506_17175 [Halomonas rituensis]
MAAHKYWRAKLMTAPTLSTLELSEFHLFDGATRVDAAATLTASAAPTGPLTNLSDNNTATGCYWSTGGDAVVLTWTFPTAVQVTGIELGARTTASRFPTALVLQGGDAVTGTGPSPEYTTLMGFGVKAFASAAKTGVMLQAVQPTDGGVIYSAFDFQTPSGIGRVPYDVKREILPATTPKTYTPQFAKVRLVRDIDGKVIREEWSDPTTGEGAFEGVDENYTYSVIAIYPSADFRAVIADRIEPEGYPG